ncbi:MAG: hypothetical protein IKC36_05625 [Clostridia bacterium]|nr:hypothetical protein [Clostridia bacterium]
MKKRTLLSVLLFVLTAFFAFACVACDKGGSTLESLKNEHGFVAQGGGFEEGAVLVSEEIEASTEEAADVLAAIADQSYDKNADVYIFDIYVEKDGVKVQPNGKVKVSVPVPNVQVDKYLVFHIKADNTVENLVPTVADGKISFEISSFSYFIIAEAAPAEHEHNYGKWMQDANSGKNHYRECACGEKEIGDCTFDNGTVTKNPSHTEEGEKTYTCTVCGGQRTEKIDKTAGHEWGEWKPSAEAKGEHYRECACGESESDACAWDKGTVTKNPSHTEEGVMTFACTVCGGTKEEAIAKNK